MSETAASADIRYMLDTMANAFNHAIFGEFI